MPGRSKLSSYLLPHEDEPIAFLVDARQELVYGTFVNGSFRSRWATYDAGRVRSWHHVDADPSQAQVGYP